MNVDQSLPIRLPDRDRAAHKGDFGRALVIGGSRGMAGAAALAGMAALRGGAGLVTVATPASCQNIVAAIEPSYMTVGLAEDGDGRIASAAWESLDQQLSHAAAVAVGPGLARSADLDQLVARLFERATPPLLIDADGLNALAEQPDWPVPAGLRILTPHPGEFRRLCPASQGDRSRQEQAAFEFARDRRVILVLKGAGTFITDGLRAFRNTTGNPGMATGGAGDVLTGLVCALLSQGLEPLEATRLAVHLHGLAGDLAARTVGEASLIARDLVQFLSDAFRAHQGAGG